MSFQSGESSISHKLVTPASVETITFVTALRRCFRSSLRLIAHRAVSFASARSAPKSVGDCGTVALRFGAWRTAGCTSAFVLIALRTGSEAASADAATTGAFNGTDL